MTNLYQKLAVVATGAALSFRVFEGNPAQAVTLTPGNLLVSTDESVYEYSPSGELVQSISVPYPGDDLTDAGVRDITVDRNGNIRAYNGTFDPFLSTFDVSSETWSHVTYSGWSTVNNISYGGIASFQDKVFVTDMETFGDGGVDTAQGIVVFDETGVSSRFAEDIAPIDLNLGLDGLLYALYPGGSPGGRSLNVYNPATLEKIREIDLVASLGWGVDRRSIAVNATGDLFVATWNGEIFHLNSEGVLLDTLELECVGLFSGSCSLYDVDISTNGIIALGSRFGDVLVTDESFSNVQSFLVGGSDTFVSIVPKTEPTPPPETVPEPSSVLGFLGLSTLGVSSLLKRKQQMER
jgi:hypothetical protein